MERSTLMGAMFALTDSRLGSLIAVAETESVEPHVVLNKILDSALGDHIKLAAQRDGITPTEALTLAIGLYCNGIRLDGSSRDSEAIQEWLVSVRSSVAPLP